MWKTYICENLGPKISIGAVEHLRDLFGLHLRTGQAEKETKRGHVADPRIYDL